jgi:YHS domain-containing protein
VIRLIVWLVLASLVLRSLIKLWQGISEGMNGSAGKSKKAVPLVRDPVCGTYVVPSKALSAGDGGQTKFFCSEQCRRAYAVKTAR